MAPVSQKEADRAIDIEAERRSLDFFEPRRLEIAKACSERFGIPIEEFVLSNETASFHFSTALIAVSEWVHDQGVAAMWARQRDENGNPFASYALMKAVSSAICRLVLHMYVMPFEQGGSPMKMLQAFATCSDPDPEDRGASSRRMMVIQVMLSARETCRVGLVKGLVGFWESGAPGGLTHDDFEPLEAFLDEHDNAEDGTEIFPAGALKDAYAMLYQELTTLLDCNAALPAPLPDSVDEWDEIGAFNAARNYLSQFSLFRRPVAIDKGIKNVTATKKTFADAAKALGSKNQFAFFESSAGSERLVLPVFNHQESDLKFIVQAILPHLGDKLGIQLIDLPWVTVGSADRAAVED